METPVIYWFEKGSHEEYGGEGLRALWMDNAEPFDGRVGAHDIMEHAREEEITSASEFEAIGSMLLVRGLGGYDFGRRPVSEHMASDIISLYRDRWAWGELPECPGLGSTITDGTGVEEWVADAVAQAIDEAPDEDVDMPREWAHRAGRWMRRGYRRALRRFQGRCPYELTADFVSITKDLDDALRRMERGDRAGVRFTYARGYGGGQWPNDW